MDLVHSDVPDDLLSDTCCWAALFKLPWVIPKVIFTQVLKKIASRG